MTVDAIGGARPRFLPERAFAAAAALLRRWQAGRLQARVMREIGDYDDHLLRDMGLTRGDFGRIVPLRENAPQEPAKKKAGR